MKLQKKRTRSAGKPEVNVFAEEENEVQKEIELQRRQEAMLLGQDEGKNTKK